MKSHEDVVHELSIVYAQNILSIAPEEYDCIDEKCDLLLKAYNDAYAYFTKVSLS